MNPENPHAFRSRLVQVLSGLLGLFVLYVLSVGPVTYWELRSESWWKPHVDERVQQFYKPLTVMAVGPFGHALEAYAFWWAKLAQSQMEAEGKLR